MTDRTCHDFQATLVDYADGELASEVARQVAEHLADCPECSRHLRMLQHSLDLAQQVWRESAIEARSSVTTVGRAYPTVAILVAIAAILLLVTGLAFQWRSLKVASYPAPSHTTIAPMTGSSPVDVTAGANESPSEVHDEGEEVIQWIARQERVARLRAAADILGQEPDLAEFKRQADLYLIKVDGHPPARGDGSQ